MRSVIKQLEITGELSRINAVVDPCLEIAAITDRVCKQQEGGRALLFEQPCGSPFPVVTNLFGSVRRVCLALGLERLEQLTEKMSALLDQIPDLSLDGLDRQIAALADFSRFTPVLRSSRDRIEMAPPDLTRFPFLQSWPDDGSAEGFPRYITLPMVFTAGPQGDNPNCGMYRCQVRGADRLAIRWKKGSGAAEHLEQYHRNGQRMPVTIALGGDPAAIFSAMFPLPGTLDEMTFAGFLSGRALEMAACLTVPLHIPANAEVVIEGYVDPAETVIEGPFGNHTGFYSPAGDAALMRVTAVTHRPAPIIPATVVGPPPMEDCWMAKAWEAVLLGFLRKLVPNVIGLSFPLEWVFHQSAVIYLEKPDPAMVRETAELLWSMHWFCAARLLILVDSAHDNTDMNRVAWSSINLAEFNRDLFYDRTGQRLGLDATGSGTCRNRISNDNEILRRIELRWQEYGIK